MYKNLLENILNFDKITIFRHIRPDGDCMFSALAMYEFIKDNFSNKSVKVLGNDSFDLINKSDKVSDKFIKESLAIILDTANTERIDDFRALNANKIIKIDHHPAYDNYGDINIVNPSSSSTCEVLTDILFSKTFSKYTVSKKVCEYLYYGINTDTLNFKTSNTSPKTHLALAKLMSKANINASDSYDYLNNKDYKTFFKINKIRESLIIEDKLGYIKLSQRQLKRIDIDPIEAKNNIEEIGNISDINIWLFAVENNGGWDVSMRSKRAYIINEIARKYRGGGHPNACGIRHINASELNNLINDLKNLSLQTKK